MLKLKSFTIFFLISSLCFSKIQSNWTNIHINEMGDIKMPTELEVQSASFKDSNKRVIEDNKIEYIYDSNNLIFQQAGLNENKPNAYKTYVRFIISTTIKVKGEFGSFKDKIKLSQKDLQDLDISLKKEVQKKLLSNTKLIKWQGIKIDQINGMNCTTFSFLRQMDENPVVVVNTIIFQNWDRSHTITYSYRLEEEANWKDLLSEMLHTILIISRKK